MKTLVTGAAGFIGSHLCEKLIEEGHEVKALIRYNSRNFWGWLEDSPVRKDVNVISGDIRDYDCVSKAVKGVDVVFNLAALISIPYSYEVQKAYVDVNINGTLNVLQAAIENGVRRVVQTSTSEVYGTAQFVPITEEHPVNPQSPYAASKSGADYMALTFYRSFNLPVVILRPFNVYGPRQSARAVIPTIITQILAGKKTIKLGSLHPTRDFTFVKDTARGFILAGTAESEKAVGEVINVGSNFEISIGSLAVKIAEASGKDIKIVSEDKRIRPKESEVERLWASSDKAGKLLGFKTEYSFEKGLKETIEFLQKNIHLYKPDIYHV